jgi:xanthine dehydrogenase molybdenum-binding subunit
MQQQGAQTMKHTAVGTRLPRLDGPAHVTGRTQFTDDLTLPGMVHGVLVRARRAHARIVSIDVARAAQMPGVLAVVAGDEGPGLAQGKVRYYGEAVAAVAAETLAQARAAARAVEIEYEPLPVITDVHAAMAPGAARVHESSESDEFPNVCDVSTLSRGDVVGGFAEADRIFEDTFETPWVHQGYVEPHASLADWQEESGRVTVWTSTQAQFGVRRAVAGALRLPLSRVRVIVPAVGGGFGGKGGVILEPIAAALSRRCRRPMKMVMTREEEFLANRPCGGSVLTLKTGVKSDGTLVALQARLLFDTGAYGGAQTGTGVTLVQGPYRIPNLEVQGYAIYTNKPSAGARRALTAPHVHFAIESQLDIIAHALGRDPVELRLRNVMGEGDPVSGDGVMPYSLPEKVIRAAASRSGWPARPARGRRGLARGVGFAAGHWTCWAGASAATVQINEDGSAAVVTGAVNLSGTDTSFAQIAAESLGIPVARVTVTQGDTDSSPHNDGTHHSRVLFGVGEAVRRAAEDAKRQLAEALAGDLGVPADHVEVAEGQVRGGGRSLSVAEAAGRAVRAHGAIVGRAALSRLPYSISSCAQVAEVEVDRETGRWELKRLVCAQDVGFAINPMTVEGQIEGGASHGIGYALCEEYVYDEQGRLLNSNFMDFRMPTSLDHPEYEVVMIEEQVDGGPFGAKGVGEPPTIPTAPAIANAIFDAVGVRVRELPITPERLYQAMAKLSS